MHSQSKERRSRGIAMLTVALPCVLIGELFAAVRVKNVGFVWLAYLGGITVIAEPVSTRKETGWSLILQGICRSVLLCMLTPCV